MNHSKVDGFNNLLRDEVSQAVISTNFTEYEKYLSEKQKKRMENRRIESIESEISDLKTDVGEIKNLLKQVLKSL
jgi:hypothetical protein